MESLRTNNTVAQSSAASINEPRQIRRADKLMALRQRDEPLGQRSIPALAAGPSLLMSARRGVGASRAAGRRAAPDALVAARAVSVQPVRAIRAPVTVARRTAPFAVLLVVAMLVKPVRAVCAAVAVARRTAMPAFCRHVSFPFDAYYSILRISIIRNYGRE